MAIMYVRIFLDFPKAFHTVKHEILIKKIAVREILNKWFISYLTKRYQVAKISNTLSEKRLRVLQGSILGSTLFLIYINDTKYSSKKAGLLFI